MPSVLFSEMIPEVRLFTPKCPNPILLKQIRESAIGFCELSTALRQNITLTTVAGQTEYELTPPADTRLHRVNSVTVNGKPLDPTSKRLLDQRGTWWDHQGTPREFWQANNGVVNLYPVPQGAETVEVELILKPSRDAGGIDQALGDSHWEAIVAGAIGNLLSMPGTDWFNPELAQQNSVRFHAGVNTAKAQIENDDRSKRATVRYGGY